MSGRAKNNIFFYKHDILTGLKCQSFNYNLTFEVNNDTFFDYILVFETNYFMQTPITV